MTVSQLCNPFHLTPVPCDLIGMKSVVMKVVITSIGYFIAPLSIILLESSNELQEERAHYGYKSTNTSVYNT